MNNYQLLNGTTLAYIGDSYYELIIRKYLIDQGYTKVNDLHKRAIKYVSAIAQAKIINHLVEANKLSDEELDIVRRGRNSKSNHQKSNVDILTYKHSTSFEALIGYLYLKNNKERLIQIIDIGIKVVEIGD